MKGMHLGHHVEPPDGVLISVQEASKAPPRPLPQPPPWLARILPGVKVSASATADSGADFDDDFDDDLDEETRKGAAIRPISFDLRAGAGLGLVGPDFEAIQSLVFMIVGYLPPSSGRIIIRGRIAPVFKPVVLNIFNENGKRSVYLASRFFGWPRSLLDSRWDEIVEFAGLDEIEFPPKTLEYDNAVTRRLLQSTVMHLDASVYVVANRFAIGTPELAERCYHLLEQRQREGCVIIHTGQEVADVGRLCHEAIWIEGGRELFRGRLGEVAQAAAQRKETEVAIERAAVPVRALLLNEEEPSIGADGGTIEIELDVFDHRLELDLELLLADGKGSEIRVERPEPFVGTDPGIYRLSISIPGGLLGEGTYGAQLLARSGANGSAPMHALLAFELIARAGESFATEFEPEYPVLADDADGRSETQDVEWNVSRAGA